MNVTFQGKRAFADVITLRLWRWEERLDYSGGPNVITRVLKRGQQEGERTEEAKGVGETGGEQAKDKGKEGKTERQEGAEEGDEAQVAAGKDSEHEAQENQIAEESWEVVHKQEGEGGREDEVKGQTRR